MTVQSLETPAAAQREVRVNDLVLEIGTSNGSGSQSANQILTRAIFEMGIPVGAKNLFPSNIQGLPTWYRIRANRHGWTGRRADADLVILMNPDSVRDDVAPLNSGTVVITRHDLEPMIERTDLQVVAVPFTEMIKEACPESRLRRLVINMLYVGVVSHLLHMTLEHVLGAIDRQFRHKPKAAELNRGAVKFAYEWAAERLAPLAHLRLEPMEGTAGKLLMDGNTAVALGAVWGGATVLAWYPITPSSSVAESAIEFLERFRRDPETGKATFAVVQAEDELAAMGMVLGAGWAGARAFTATSGPGISLMAEQAGLGYFAEIPAVIVDVQRMGPSTGLPTRTCQNDIAKVYNLSHGDCRQLLLMPATPQECFDFACEAFNYAERFQTPIFLMSDLDLGMNLWMTDPLTPPTKPIDRGKVLSAEELERLGGEWKRYGDVDGDGIPWRTLPGTDHPRAAYFTRGTGHNETAGYTERPEDWKRNIDRLAKKFDTARNELPAPLIDRKPGATTGLILYGSAEPSAHEALWRLEQEAGLVIDTLRLRALPAHDEVKRFIESYDHVYVLDLNRDAQVAGILRQDWPRLAPRIRDIRHYDGSAVTAQAIIDQLLELEEIPARAAGGNGGHSW